jgi:carboxylesterase
LKHPSAGIPFFFGKLRRQAQPWAAGLAVGIGLALLFSLLSCELNPASCDEECQSHWLDGDSINDYSSDVFRDSPKFDSTVRLSTRVPQPDSTLLTRPVILCAHGFSATTYEWKDFADFITNRFQANPDSILISRVLLGGHGVNLADFKASTWPIWLQPILDEYDTLVAMGYKNISLAGASTAAPLILEALHQGHFRKQPPKEIFFIDPIIVPSNQFLTLAKIIGPLVGHIEDVGTEEEQKHWYSLRPAAQLTELYSLINRAKNRLEGGQTLPKGIRLKVYKSKKDGSADPVSALYLKKGLRHADGSQVEIEMEDSDLHVFTRLSGRAGNTLGDTLLQQTVFSEMTRRVTSR